MLGLTISSVLIHADSIGIPSTTGETVEIHDFTILVVQVVGVL